MVSCLEIAIQGGRGAVEGGGNLSSSWLRTLCRVREGVGEDVGSWFEDNIRLTVGDGRDTLFWYDIWVGISFKIEISPPI